MKSLISVFSILSVLSMVFTTRVDAGIELSIPGVENEIVVVLPEDHDPSKRYPAIFYYHGMSGIPNTRLINRTIETKGWILVGMAYQQRGAYKINKESIAKELLVLKKTMSQLDKYGLNRNRCYLGGFSKGGILVDTLLQAEPSLAGGIIMGGGHVATFNPKLKKYGGNKSIFIGVGREDGNYIFSLKSLIYHRKLGATVTIDEWPNVKHAYPKHEIPSLTQWCEIELLGKEKVMPRAQKEIAERYAEIIQLKPYEQWQALLAMRNMPYVKLLGKDWQEKIQAKIATISSDASVAKEAIAYNKHRFLLAKEVKAKTLNDLVKVFRSYEALVKTYATTEQTKLARVDKDRVATIINASQKANADKKKQKKEEVDPFGPNQPNDRDRVPVNPLNR